MGRKKGLPLNGWLVLDKPAGMTSTQALGKVRWLLNAQKAGHGGTLDPMATGILPLAFGEATKTVPFAMDGEKTYHFQVRWGEQRSTDDAEGEVVATAPGRPTREAILAALPKFIGNITQTPPAVSAIKVDGERAYDLVRAGEVVELKPRQVDVYAFRLLNQPDADHADFEVECGKGTYMRALARDLALTLGTLGHISALRRLRVGPFTLENAIPLDKIASMSENARAEELLLPVMTALADIPALAISADEAQRLRLGQRLSFVPKSEWPRLEVLPQDVRQGECPVLAMCGDDAVAIAEIVAGELRTVRVLHPND